MYYIYLFILWIKKKNEIVTAENYCVHTCKNVKIQTIIMTVGYCQILSDSNDDKFENFLFSLVINQNVLL